MLEMWGGRVALDYVICVMDPKGPQISSCILGISSSDHHVIFQGTCCYIFCFVLFYSFIRIADARLNPKERLICLVSSGDAPA